MELESARVGQEAGSCIVSKVLPGKRDGSARDIVSLDVEAVELKMQSMK